MAKKIAFVLAVSAAFPLLLQGTENLPQIPFAETARLPEPKQFVITPWYDYSMFRKLWIGHSKTSIELQSKDDFELNNGMLRLDYGISKRIALDVNVGYTSAATREWTPDNEPRSAQGFMDTQFGVRFRVLDERETDKWYAPTLTARLGGIIEGSYDSQFPMAPGDGASGIEWSVLSTKVFPKYGLGAYADFGYRLRNHGVPQTLFGSAGVSETLKFNWLVNSLTLYAGYRGLYDLNGGDFSGQGRVASSPFDFIDVGYRSTAQEIYHRAEVGLGFSDKDGRRYFFSCSHPFDGRNTGKSNNFTIGINFPLGL
jgi:hypothetical protein